MSGIFATNRTDNKNGFYRIIQPLRFLKRSGWEARTIPFTGKDDISILPISDELLVRLSLGLDYMLTSTVKEEDELLKMMNLRRQNNAKWIVDVSENFLENIDLQPYLENIIRSIMLADGVIVSSKQVAQICEPHNKNVYVLPSTLDFKMWDLKPVVSRKLKIGYRGTKQDIEKVTPSIKALSKEHNFEMVSMNIEGIIDLPKQLSKLGLSMAVLPLEDNNFNRCKDNIDLLELMALKIPIVASPIATFRKLPILYAENNFQWYESIEKLIKDKQYRQKIGLGEYFYVKKHYDMTKYVSNLQSWLKKLERKDY